MNIYICDLPLFGPLSEYGGMVIVVAESQAQCAELLTAEYADRYDVSGYWFDVNLAMDKVKQYQLDPTCEYYPRVVATFET